MGQSAKDPFRGRRHVRSNLRQVNAGMAAKKFNALPGFGLTMGFTLVYLSVIVLIPIGGLIFKALGMSWADLWRLATTDRAMAAYRLTFGASFVAAFTNAIFGTILAWVLVRYHFPGRRFVDALVDIPFADRKS